MTPENSTQSAVASQVLAADPTQSVWLSANAGTGKTRVLIDRISRLLLAGTPPAKILCLTFTKAAAAEMANRLNERLGEWAAIDDVALRSQLSKLLGRAVEDSELVPARHLFAFALETPGGLKIRTIHAFCEGLLGQFPLEAGVPAHFSVIDERTEAELLSESRDAVLRRAADVRDPRLGTALKNITVATSDLGFDTVMRELLSDRQKFHDTVRRHGSIDGVADAACRVLDLDPEDNGQSLLVAAADDDAVDGPALRQAVAALSEGSKTDRERAVIIADWLDHPQIRTAGLLGSYAGVFLTKTGQPRAESGLMTKKPRLSHPQTFDALIAEQGRLLALNEKLKAAETVHATAALLVLGEAMLAEYQGLKDRRGLLDYDDLILKARDLLEADGAAAWVHFKLDGGIDHILVDEAQDTSPEQWGVIRSLAGEFFAGESARRSDRTIFAVGDEKQSIYGFQGADPEAFSEMETYFAERAHHSGNPWRSVEMPLSFRSVWAVLRTVDAVFADETAADGLTFGGRTIRHLSNRLGQAGLIEVWPTVKPAEIERPDPWDTPLDRLSADSPQVRLANRIANRIADWLNNGEVLESTGRPIVPGDIMILVRRRERFAEEMIRCLKQRRIAVAGSDRMLLTDQLATMDLLALARFAVLPEDDLSLAEILKGPLCGLNDDDLFELAYERKGTLWRELVRRAAEKPSWNEAGLLLSRVLETADFAPPFEFFSRLLGPQGGRRRILSRLGPEADDPIDEFLSLALDYERENAPSLQGFLHWVEAGETQIKRDLELGGEEVRVMTVHGAKGLQAGIVILPDTCKVPDARTGSNILWAGGDDDLAPLWPGYRDNEGALCQTLRDEGRHDQQREYRRLLYVAMTRAKDRLYVCGWEGKHGRTDGCWYDLIAKAVRETGNEVSLDGGETFWQVRDRQEADPDSKAETFDKPRPAGDIPDWARRPPAPEPEPVRPLTPSRPDSEEPPVNSPLFGDRGERFKKGRLIHTLLQNLPDLPAVARRRAAISFLARPVHGVSDAEGAEIAEETLRVMEDPRFAAFFGEGSLAEVPLIGLVGNQTVSAQVDRLLITPDKVSVIDFKTNRPPPKKNADVPSVYLRQMAVYREALRGIFPGRPVECILLWTDGPNAMKLEDRQLDPHMP
jgi:ATP-dependent helicase/nuclease subunit A